MNIPLIFFSSFIFSSVCFAREWLQTNCLFQVEYGRVVAPILGVSWSEFLLERIEIINTADTFIHKENWML